MSVYLVAVVLLGYAAWAGVRWMRDAKAVPHWTTAAAVGVAALLLEAHALTALIGSGVDWTYQVLAIVAFGLIAPTTIAWGIVGSLWLHHRAQDAAPRREAASVRRHRDARALMNAPTQRMRHI